jgi:phage protein D
MPGPSSPINISVNGVPLLPNFDYDVMEVVVDLHSNKPGMFTIRIQDRNLGPIEAPIWTYIDPPVPFIIGAMISISASNASESLIPPIPIPLISGEITAIEAEFNEDSVVVLVVRGYTKTQRLLRGRKTASYMLMPDNLVISKVCLAAGVPVVAAPTGGPIEYLLQDNQSDWDFILERAKRIGYEFLTSPLGINTFKPKGIPAGVPTVLTYGGNLLSFKPRVSSHGQVSMVSVQGWDPLLKMPIQSMFPVPPTPIGGNTVRIALDMLGAKLFGATAQEVISDEPNANMAEALIQATAQARGILSDFVQAEGECVGNPALYPGAPIMVLGVGVKFTGPYVLTSATHVYVHGRGYRTIFRVSGSQADTITDLLSDGGSPEVGARQPGVVIGVVTNNMDPLQMGRVKVRFPHLGSLPPVLSNWCRVVSQSGGMMSGSYFIPDINTEVLVAFEHGNVNYPYILGTLWNNLDRPPKPTAAVVLAGKVIERIIQTPMGLKMVMSDMPGKMGITLSDKLGLNAISIDAVKGAISLQSLTEISMDTTIFKVSAKAKASIEALADMSIASKASLKIDGAIVAIKSLGTLDLKATALASVTGTGGLMLKGGGGSISMVGPLVSINNGALDIM